MSLHNYQEVETFQSHGFRLTLIQDVLSDGSVVHDVKVSAYKLSFRDEKEAIEAFEGIKAIVEKSW
jgi:hypothetical protein